MADTAASGGSAATGAEGAATTTTTTGAEGAAAGAAGGGQAAGGQQQQQAQPADPAAGAAGAAGADDRSEPWNDPERARAVIEQLRKEAGDQRIEAKRTAADEARKALATDLIKFLDPNAGGEEVTVEQLQGKLVEAGARGDSAERRAAIIEAAWGEGIDRSKLGYLEFELGRDPRLAAMSHSAEEFGATLTAAIQARVSADPSLKTPGAVTTTGAEAMAGGQGADAVTKAQFDAMSLQDRTRLFREDKATYDRLVNS